MALAFLGFLIPVCGAPGAAALENGGKVSINSQHEIKPAIKFEDKSGADPDASYESKSGADYESHYLSKSEPDAKYESDYESKSEADYDSDYDSNYDCGAVNGQMHTPLESRSAPAAISMALNLKAEAQSRPTCRAMLSSHHSPLPVGIKDHDTAEVQHAQQDAGDSPAQLQFRLPTAKYRAMTANNKELQTSMACSSDGQCINEFVLR